MDDRTNNLIEIVENEDYTVINNYFSNANNITIKLQIYTNNKKSIINLLVKYVDKYTKTYVLHCLI